MFKDKLYINLIRCEKRMIIKKEHIKILECLFCDNYSTKEIGEILCMPETKVQRYLRELYTFYKIENMFQLKLKLNGNWLEEIKKVIEVSKKDRINYILISFLNKDILNLNEVHLVLDVSRRILSEDLKVIQHILEKFNLVYKSLNSKGIELIGDEKDKKKLFNTTLFYLFLERDYLPSIFNFLFYDFNQIIDKKIQSFTFNRIKKISSYMHTYLILQIELLIYIGIIRNNRVLSFYKLKDEIKAISKLCNENVDRNLSKYHKVKNNEVNRFIKHLNKFINFSKPILNEVDITESLIQLFRLIEYKNIFKIKKYYLLNKSFQNGYKEKRVIYITLIGLIEDYFEKRFKYKIDSFDKITFFLLLQNSILLNNKKKINNQKNIIVYNFLQKIILNNLVKELEGESIIISDVISSYALESYLENNSVKNIIVFENIDFQSFIKINDDISVIKLSLPFEKEDLFNINIT